jgi:hypothetical protein
MAVMDDLQNDELWCMPACTYCTLVACMAGPINSGQDIITYLHLPFLPFIIIKLAYLALPSNLLVTTIVKSAALYLCWHACSVQHKKVKKFKKPFRESQKSIKQNEDSPSSLHF